MPAGVKFKDVWESSPVAKKSFEDAKVMLMDAVELSHPNSNYPLALFTDASDHSVGGSLQMLTPEGHFKSLGFYSAHLNEAQKKYSVFKKELLGAHKSLRHFLPDVYGKHLVIYSDHLPLAQAFQNNNLPLQDPQVHRQITEIGRFTRDIKHVSGVNNVFADFLSRIRPEHRGTAYQVDGEETPPIEQELAATESVQFQVTSLKAIEDLQDNCEEIAKIKSGDKPKSATFDVVRVEGH